MVMCLIKCDPDSHRLDITGDGEINEELSPLLDVTIRASEIDAGPVPTDKEYDIDSESIMLVLLT